MVEISAANNAALFFRQSQQSEEDSSRLQADNTVKTDNNATNTVNRNKKKASASNAFDGLATLKTPNKGGSSSSSHKSDSSNESKEAKEKKKAEAEETEESSQSAESVPGSFSDLSLRGLAEGGAVSPQTAEEIKLHGIPASVKAQVSQIESDIKREHVIEAYKKAQDNHDLLDTDYSKKLANNVAEEDVLLSRELDERASEDIQEEKHFNSVPKEGSQLVPPGTNFATSV
ncbi:MAG: hypothetical protein H6908_03990 [Hyphomicrobiales bacterium]|nr:hypothetical protein [Hyphomicrobiales bacterium]